MSIRTALLVVALVGVAAVSCTDGLFGPASGPLRLIPDSMVLLISDYGSFNVRYEVQDDLIEPRSVEWTSYGPAIAFVDPQGLVLALDTGTTAIAARTGDSRGLATVTVVQIEMDDATAGWLHSCGWVEDGAAYCWGLNSYGQLGTDDAVDGCGDDLCSFRPIQFDGGLSFSVMAAGGEHTCGLSGDRVHCWGRNLEGQLGDGTTGDGGAAPVAIASDRSFRGVTAGRNHSCAITVDGEAYCWGDNSDGQLGTGDRDPGLAPRAVAGELRFGAIAAGERHTCALTTEGEAYCWGSNDENQLGRGSRNTSNAPVAVAGDHRFVVLSAGDLHNCAITASNEAYCWGDNNQGQLGAGNRASTLVPVLVDRHLFVDIAAGGSHSCGIELDGTTSCWGWNGYRQIGNDSGLRRRPRPTKAKPDIPLQTVDAGWLHTCSGAGDGQVRCWGYNGAGQMGRSDRMGGCPTEEKQQCAPVPVPPVGIR